MTETIEYEVGDVIQGRFSCLIDQVSVRAIVRSRIPNADGNGRGGFNADCIDYMPGKGYGAWGYDDEIASVRPGTQADEDAAADVKQRVSADTQKWLRG